MPSQPDGGDCAPRIRSSAWMETLGSCKATRLIATSSLKC